MPINIDLGLFRFQLLHAFEAVLIEDRGMMASFPRNLEWATNCSLG